jgi:hypothetical protein
MKKRKAKAPGRPVAPAEVASNFTRGMVATGLLSAFQDRWTVGKPPSRKVVRQALQGGIALAAGCATAESMRGQDYFAAVAALALGTLGVVALETLLASEPTEFTGEIELG